LSATEDNPTGSGSSIPINGFFTIRTDPDPTGTESATDG
jgi:hypothetical protein